MRLGLKTLVLVATAVAAVVLLAGSCASTAKSEAKKDEWTGRKIDEVIAKFGTPSTVTPGENGEKTYVWLLHRSMPFQRVTYDSLGNPVYSTLYRDSVHSYMFSVDASGTITSWEQSATNVANQSGY
jgi:predicted component of type VI protein secretion system